MWRRVALTGFLLVALRLTVQVFWVFPLPSGSLLLAPSLEAWACRQGFPNVESLLIFPTAALLIVFYI